LSITGNRCYLDDFTDAEIETMADCAENRSSRSTMIFVQHLGDAMRRMRPDETAFAVRDAAFVMNFMGDWRDAHETPRHVEWAREAWNRLPPHSTGAVYLNYRGHDERDATSLARVGFSTNYDRLAQIKAKYDPTNLFRFNRSIKVD
jgi:FAD/FMN-containing dehydrogenase